MNVIVCIKQVPEVADAELELDEEGTDVDRDDLVMSINEWDNYAVEAAVRLKEAHGGTVTVVSLGDEDADDILRRALAMGADHAVRIDEEDFAGSDGMGVARALAAVVRDIPFDLVLTGAQAADDGWGQVGVALAELLDVPYASLVVELAASGETLIVERELEQNTLEKVELRLPALVTVQTGLNEPRYVSIMGIRKVRSVEIREVDADELELDEETIGQAGSAVATRRLAVPERGDGAEMLTGSLEAICDRAAQIIRERGGVGR